jgi:hypothetical protein
MPRKTEPLTPEERETWIESKACPARARDYIRQLEELTRLLAGKLAEAQAARSDRSEGPAQPARETGDDRDRLTGFRDAGLTEPHIAFPGSFRVSSVVTEDNARALWAESDSSLAIYPASNRYAVIIRKAAP